MEKVKKKWYQIWWVWYINLIVPVTALVLTMPSMGSIKQVFVDTRSSSSSSASCIGNQGCITNVRSNFENSGKQILGEEYLGDGKFGISFLDARRGLSANAKVTTDCNCNVLNVDVSVMR